MLMIALVFVFEIICLSEGLAMSDDVHIWWWWWWALMLFCFWNLMTHDIVDDFWLLACMTIMMWVTMTSPVSLFHKKVRKPSRPGFSSGRIANLYLNITNSPARQSPSRFTFYLCVHHFWLYTMHNNKATDKKGFWSCSISGAASYQNIINIKSKHRHRRNVMSYRFTSLLKLFSLPWLFSLL